MSTLKQFFASLAIGVLGASGGYAATLENGSLTGPVANAGLPDGWAALLGNPDTMDETSNFGVPGFGFETAPSGASPDGGTWVGMGRDDVDSFAEIFGQRIDDFVVGQTYRLSWYGGNFGADLTTLSPLLPCYCETNSIFASLDGALIGMGGDLVTGPDWVAQSLTFTATSTSHLLAFGLTSAGPSYVSIDGISVSAVPLPAGGALLVSGLLGFAALRRRTSR